jgi:hypothetical protein
MSRYENTTNTSGKQLPPASWPRFTQTVKQMEGTLENLIALLFLSMVRNSKEDTMNN